LHPNFFEVSAENNRNIRETFGNSQIDRVIPGAATVEVNLGLYSHGSGGAAKGSPSRISFEKSGESLAARTRVSIRLRVLSSAKGSPLVTMTWRSYSSSSPLPLSRMRQSHGTRSLAGCCVRMLVVQLVVMALYQRGL